MDANQTERMIEWLDEERRRDRATIARLEERLNQQQEFMETMTRRQGALESDHASMRTAYLPVGRDTDLMELMRNEQHQQLEAIEARRLTAERESERRAEVARDTIARPIREMAERIEALEDAITELPGARVERDRFAAALAGLQQRLDEVAKRLDDPDRRLTFLEEQRRQDLRRLAELQTELPDLQKRVDGIKPKLELLEEMTLHNEKRVLELQNQERERRDELQQFIDQQTLLVQQRDQKIEDVMRGVGQYDEVMSHNMERFESWAEAYRQMKQVIDDFSRISERLDRRINEVAEMQRLSEERFRTEWNAWNADDQKRWRTFTLTNDDTWRTHDHEFDLFRAKLVEFGALFGPISDSLDRLWKLQRAQADMFRDRFQGLLAEHDLPAEHARTVVNANGNGTNGRSSSTNLSRGE
jgi:chromosome segregation ATPase